MNRLSIASVATTALLSVYFLSAQDVPADPVNLDQGPDWSAAEQPSFYSLDQGSRLMPLSWFRALRLADGSSLVDGLARYGYLPNAHSPAKLPIGFSTAGGIGSEIVGLTCSACHTRQIEAKGVTYRIDGGPAFIDFQAFLVDIDSAVTRVLADETAFAAFAGEVLGKGDDDAAAQLRQSVQAWHDRYSTWARGSLQGVTWGLGRLDAVAMIMNRVTGLGLGEPPHHMLPNNIKPADAPARYPFLWNAGKQDRTQWTGFAPNRKDDAKLVRNIGQVLGVFAEYRPRKNPAVPPFKIDFVSGNSTNLTGLKALESAMNKIGPPRWPWDLDQALADRGEEIYRAQCDSCHAANPGEVPWRTPVVDAGTDTRQLALLRRSADPGVLTGVAVPFMQIAPLKDGDRALDMVRVSALGTAIRPGMETPTPDTPPKPGYTARVLHGVWAAAPYLHNGSVPTLADLLEPVDKRPPSFQVGPSYDPDRVGLAVQQPQNGATLVTTDCSDRNSGNSRCGHDWGTQLPEPDKRALLEYLKKL
jgi:cytochrome c5